CRANQRFRGRIRDSGRRATNLSGSGRWFIVPDHDLGISVYIGPAHCYRRVLAVGICNHGSGDGYLPVGMVSPSIRCTRARTDPGILAYYLVGVLFGLAMDYQLFISSGMREAYVHGSPAPVAVQEGFQNGRAVVIAAALIMMS